MCACCLLFEHYTLCLLASLDDVDQGTCSQIFNLHCLITVRYSDRYNVVQKRFGYFFHTGIIHLIYKTRIELVNGYIYIHYCRHNLLWNRLVVIMTLCPQIRLATWQTNRFVSSYSNKSFCVPRIPDKIPLAIQAIFFMPPRQ